MRNRFILLAIISALGALAGPALAWFPYGNTVTAPVGYVPFAVHIDNRVTRVDTNAVAPAISGVTLSNSHAFTTSFWIKPRKCITNSTGNTRADSSCFGNLFAGTMVAPNNSEATPGLTLVWDNASGPNGTLRYNIGDPTASTAAGLSHACNIAGVFGDMTDNNWHQYFMAGNVNQSGTAQFDVVYKDGALVNTGCVYGLGGPMTIGVGAVGWQLHANPAGNPNDLPDALDVADLIQDYTAGPVCVSTASITWAGLTGNCSAFTSTPFTPANILALFYNSGPVDPGANCTTAMGFTPDFCFHDTSKTTWGTNKGLVTNVTNVNAVYAAPTTPVTTPTRPYIDFSTSATTSTGPWGTASATFFTNTNTVGANDILILYIKMEAVSGSDLTDRLPACPTTGTWTQIDHRVPTTAGGVMSNTACVSTGATAGFDVNGDNTFTYTSGALSGIRTAVWLLVDLKGTTGSSALDGVAGFTTTSSAATMTAPAITTAGSADTLLSFYAPYGTGFNVGITALASGQDKLGSVADGTGDLTVGQEYLATACTATCSRTATIAASDDGTSLTVAVKP